MRIRLISSMVLALLAACTSREEPQETAIDAWVEQGRAAVPPEDDLPDRLEDPREMLFELAQDIGGDARVLVEDGQAKIQIGPGALAPVDGVKGPVPGGMDILLEADALVLRGTAESEEERRRIERLARAHAGALRVESRLALAGR